MAMCGDVQCTFHCVIVGICDCYFVSSAEDTSHCGHH